MIFHSSDFSKVDLIKFKGLTVSRGGFSLDAKVSFIRMNIVYYGTVAALESSKGKASIKCLDLYGVEKIEKIAYTSLTPISDEVYLEKIEESKIEAEKYKFTIGQKVTWITKGQNPIQLKGEVAKLNNSTHKATLKYLDESITIVSFLDISKL